MHIFEHSGGLENNYSLPGYPLATDLHSGFPVAQED